MFTPIDELRQKEPEFFARSQPEVSATEPKAPVIRTAVQVLEEGAKKAYDEKPAFHTISERTTTSGALEFVVKCTLRLHDYDGTGKTKKAAKQAAAAAVLRAVVDKGRHVQFGIPGVTKDDALKYIDNLLVDDVPTGSKNFEFDATVNWVGKVQELCQKQKIRPPDYSEEAQGPPNDRTFTVKCKVNSTEESGIGKTKKTAKNMAAAKMYHTLDRDLAAMQDDLPLEDECDETAAIDDSALVKENEARARVDKIVDPVQTLQDAVENRGKENGQTSTIDYRKLDNPDMTGLTQVLLKMKLYENDQMVLSVFPGSGSDEKEARKAAARSALFYIEHIVA